MFSALEQTELRQMMAERSIYRTLMRYCRGADRADQALMASAYHEEATEDHGPFHGKSLEFVKYGIRAIKGDVDWTEGIESHLHHITNFSVQFTDEKTANVESGLFYCYRHKVAGNRINAFFSARYLDLFSLREDWRILRRKVVLDQYFEVPMDTVDSDLAGSFIRGIVGPEDPSYAFPEQ